MVTIVVLGILESDFLANIEIENDYWDYECVILLESEDRLFCYGPRLHRVDDALIQVFKDLGFEDGSVLDFTAEFRVYEFVPTKTVTPTRRPATAIFSPSPTFTPWPSTTTSPPWATRPTPGT
jgi:hypothetical protein